MRYLLIIFLFLQVIINSPSVTNAEELINVKLVNYIGETSKLKIQLKGEYFTLDSTFSLMEGKTYHLKVKGGEFFLEGKGVKQRIKGPLFLIPASYDHKHNILINDRPYLGVVEFHLENDKFIRPVNQLPLEDYLKGVVPFEVLASWPLETLKAQALAARTYAVSHLGKVIDDTINYQVYGGYAWHANTTKAVEETAGEVITFNGKLIEALYSSSNGGITENNTHVWSGKTKPYFPIKEDPFDPTNPWELALHETQIDLEDIQFDEPNWWAKTKEKDKNITAAIKMWLKNIGYKGDIRILSVPRFELANEQLESGRSVKGSIEVVFLHNLIDGTIIVEQVTLLDEKLNRIRSMLGGGYFKSYFITSLEHSGDKYIMKGRGYGHGVGMSQYGASVMGEKGKTYEDIIQFYYPGTTITRIIESE